MPKTVDLVEHEKRKHQSDPVIPRFHYLLREAMETGDSVDMFDLDSDNQASIEEFERLETAQHAAALALVLHVLAYGVELVGAFKPRE